MLTRSAIKLKASALIKAFNNSFGNRKHLILKDIFELIKTHPDSKALFKSDIRKQFLKLSYSSDVSLSGKSRQVLALLGSVPPPKGNGLRILSIDGGGTRGVISMEIIRHIERVTKKKTHELFDLICGVSSGAIIAMAVGSGKYTLDECETFYRNLSETVFKSDLWSSTPRLILNHAYYDASVFEDILKKYLGRASLISMASSDCLPKLVAVSVNARTVQPYLFRTYDHRSSAPIFDGTYKAEIWQALRASSAAPGYFREFSFGPHMLLDGGMLVNNCTGIACAEACSLWPNESIQCLISVGTGKFKQKDIVQTSATSLYEKAHSLVYSATDTETVHTTMRNLVSNYFRFNPQLSESIFISEKRKAKLDLIKQEAHDYMIDNKILVKTACDILTKTRPFYRKALDYFHPVTS